MSQPLTATQLARRIGSAPDSCSHVLSAFVARGLAICLNPAARSSRLYWLTEAGRQCRTRLFPASAEAPLGPLQDDFAGIDWALYGWVCFRHRAAVISVLGEPMQPARIKRRIRQLKPGARISANNVRDIIRLFLQKGIVRSVLARKKAHPRYELTEVGARFRKLLHQAAIPTRGGDYA